jgi:hypothetical protein
MMTPSKTHFTHPSFIARITAVRCDATGTYGSRPHVDWCHKSGAEVPFGPSEAATAEQPKNEDYYSGDERGNTNGNARHNGDVELTAITRRPGVAHFIAPKTKVHLL